MFWAIVFFVVALTLACVDSVAAVGTTAWTLKLLVMGFFALSVVSLFSGRKRPA
jgi:uncharacterized membrane protein YtjA (UPF0391 family)